MQKLKHNYKHKALNKYNKWGYLVGQHAEQLAARLPMQLLEGVRSGPSKGLSTEVVAKLVPGLVELGRDVLFVQGQHQLLSCHVALGVPFCSARQELGELLAGDGALVQLVLELLSPHQLCSKYRQELKLLPMSSFELEPLGPDSTPQATCSKNRYLVW